MPRQTATVCTSTPGRRPCCTERYPSSRSETGCRGKDLHAWRPGRRDTLDTEDGDIDRERQQNECKPAIVREESQPGRSWRERATYILCVLYARRFSTFCGEGVCIVGLHSNRSVSRRIVRNEQVISADPAPGHVPADRRAAPELPAPPPQPACRACGHCLRVAHRTTVDPSG